MIKLYGLLDRAKQNAHQDFAGHKLLKMLRERKAEKYGEKNRK